MLVEREGRVSVWVGRFAGEPALRSYVEVSYDGDEGSCPFWADAGAGWFDEDFLEAEFHPGGLVAGRLVARHSYGRSFAGPAEAALAGMPAATANAVIVAYDVEHVPERAAPEGPVWFVGSFDYQRTG